MLKTEDPVATMIKWGETAMWGGGDMNAAIRSKVGYWGRRNERNIIHAHWRRESETESKCGAGSWKIVSESDELNFE